MNRTSTIILFVILNCFLSSSIIAEQAKINNVLFIVSDDLKASVLGSYGDAVCKTPNIDKLAREGMVFKRAFSNVIYA
jgi:hypothetical protein